MLKMMILGIRRDGMTHEEFRRYVVEVHGPLVKSVTEVAKDILHYHYNFPVPGALDTAFGHPLAERDIVTQGWFESLEVQLNDMKKKSYLEIVRPDEQRFANGQLSIMHYTSEREVVAGPVTTNKIFYFRRRHPSLTRAAFQEQWLKRFPEALQANSAFDKVVSRYLQNQVLPESNHPDGSNEKFYDVIDEFSLPQLADLALLREDKGAMIKVQELEQELLDPSRTRAYVAELIMNIP